ncbi:hypothetical protein CKJ70_26190 [Mycobacterium avium]|nr:hypothetical protein CKJ70_26190 [Mycobacterium avium]
MRRHSQPMSGQQPLIHRCKHCRQCTRQRFLAYFDLDHIGVWIVIPETGFDSVQGRHERLTGALLGHLAHHLNLNRDVLSKGRNHL